MDIEKEIYELLKEKEIYPMYIGQYETLPVYMVTIEGDWKHDHLYMRNVMEEAGYSQLKEECLPSGSDWYASTHYFIKTF